MIKRFSSISILITSVIFPLPGYPVFGSDRFRTDQARLIPNPVLQIYFLPVSRAFPERVLLPFLLKNSKYPNSGFMQISTVCFLIFDNYGRLHASLKTGTLNDSGRFSAVASEGKQRKQVCAGQRDSRRGFAPSSGRHDDFACYHAWLLLRRTSIQ